MCGRDNVSFSFCFVARLHVNEFNSLSFTSASLAMLLVWRVGVGKNAEDTSMIDRLISDLPIYFFAYSESLFVFKEVFLFKLKMNATVFCFPCRAMPAG